MSQTKVGDRLGLLLVGSAIGAAIALLLAPESGIKTRRKLARAGEDAADYLIGACEDLVERCEDLQKRSSKLASKAARELSEKYRDLSERSRQLADEAVAIIRRAAD